MLRIVDSGCNLQPAASGVGSLHTFALGHERAVEGDFPRQPQALAQLLGVLSQWPFVTLGRCPLQVHVRRQPQVAPI